jgi:HKD family nuclease
MDVRWLAASERIRELSELLEWASEVQVAYAWVSAAGASEHWTLLHEHREKLTTVVVGTDFDRTDPLALRDLLEWGLDARVHRAPNGVFHPKLIVGLRGRQARAIVGSSNFTVGGFAANAESNLAVTGPRSAATIQGMLESLRGWHRAGGRITPAWLDEYAERYKLRRREWLRRSLPDDGSFPVAEDLDRPWPEYFRLVTREADSLMEAEYFTKELSSGRSFLDLSDEEVHIVGGYGGKGSGWYGPVRHRGVMRHFRDSRRRIAQALDPVPLSGQGAPLVRAARRCLEQLTRLSYVGLPSATRLLAAKRPDAFFCLNHANESRVKELFGRGLADNRDTDGYIALHEAIWQMRWFQSPRPREPEQRRAWDLRVLLIDRLLYWDTPEVPKRRGRK